MTLNEKRKKYAHEYYLKHKKQYLENNKKWIKNNKVRFYELVKKSRTKRANKLKSKGEMYVWRSNADRKKLYERRNNAINNNTREREI